MSSQEGVDTSTVAEMEETIARISSHKGVEGVIIMDCRGSTIWYFYVLHICYVLLMSWSMMSLRMKSHWIEMICKTNFLTKSLLAFAHILYNICLIYTLSGSIIQSTLDEEQSKTHAAALSDLSCKASYIVGMLNPDDELTFLRIRSKQREIMVCNLLHVFVFEWCSFFIYYARYVLIYVTTQLCII